MIRIQGVAGQRNALHCADSELLIPHFAVPDMVREAEAVLLHKQAAESGKPANVVEKMVLGRLNK